METMCCYPEKHALADMDDELYGIIDFNELPEDPVSYDDVSYVKYENGNRIHRSVP